MAVGIAIKVNQRNLQRNLRDLARFFDDTPKLLSAIGDRHLAWIDENFRKGGAEKKWRPLSANTIAARRQGSSAILQDTGRLKQSFVKKLGSDRVDVGTEEKKAKWHHEGTKPFDIRPRSAKVLRFVTAGGIVFTRAVRHPGLPARPLLPSDTLGERLALETAEAAVDAAAKKASG